MKGLKILITSLVLIFAFGSIALAQELPEVTQDEEIKAGDLEIVEPKVLPDHPFYFLKNWARRIQLVFTFNPVKKAELRLKFSNEKLMEVKKLVEKKKDPEVIKKATENYQQEVEKIKDETEKIKEKAKENPQVESFLDKFIHQQTLHQKLLQKLENQVPPQVFEKIKETRERHLERFKDVMLKLEDKDKIPERLEKDIEKVKGSKFKEFKDLEVLDEIKEKMPEDVKQKIEERMAQITEKFRNKLEGMPDEEKEKFKTYLEQISGNKLKHLEIISNLEGEEISDKLRDVMEKAKEKKVEEVAEEEKTIWADVAQSQIAKAEEEIKKAEEAISTTSENEYGGRAAKRLLELAKEHLDRAKKAFDEGKYGRAFGLAVASYHEAINAEKIVEKIGEIKKSPEKMREKMEKLYPGIELPKEVTKCKIPLMKKCTEGKASIVEKDEEGCPIFQCEEIKKPIPPEKIVCPMLWDPVCGKDGKTYSNECVAKLAGVEIAYKGMCKETGQKVQEKIISKIPECERNENLNIKDRCYRDAAEETGDINLCERITDLLTKDACIDYMVGKLKLTDPLFCEKITQSSYRDSCYLKIGARFTKNPILCEKINSQDIKDFCYRVVAVETKDEPLCKKIKDEFLREKCINELKK